MMDKFEKPDSTVIKEIVERPVDLFYSDVTCIITMSFDNLPETNSIDTESWNKFLADSWNQYFAESDNIFDFLKHSVYYTCLAGRFYKMNSFLSLDDAVYLIKDRFHSADTLYKTWHQLHKLARLIQIEKCKESFSASLALDLHIRTDGVCVDSEDNENILQLMYLPSEEERVLVFHITVRYNIDEDTSLLTSSRNLSDLSSDFSHNSTPDKPGILKESKYATSPMQSDSFSKSFDDFNETGNWEKYGARPKSKRSFPKNSSNTTANLNEYGTMDCPEKLAEKDVRPKGWRKMRRRDRSDRASAISFMKNEDNCANEARIKDQDLSISKKSCLKEGTVKRSPLHSSDSFTGSERGRKFTEYRHSSRPSCSDMTSQTDSKFKDKEHFGSLTDATSDYELSPTKSDSCSPAPLVPTTSEDNSYYEKYGARPKDNSLKYGCKVRGNKEYDRYAYFEKGAGAAESASHDLITPKYFEHFKDLERISAIKTEKEEIPKEVQEEYEKMVSYFKSGETQKSSISDTNDNEISTRSTRQEYTSVTQEHTSLNMPIIRFKQNTAGDDKSMKAKEVLEPDVRANIFRGILKLFFENYKFPDASFQDNQSSGTTMTPNLDRDCYRAAFYSAGSELDRIPFVDAEDTEEVNISEASNRTKIQSFDDAKFGRFAIKTFDDKISFDWKYASKEKSPIKKNRGFTFSHEISLEKADHSEDTVITVDGKPMEDTDETYDSFLEAFVQNLTKSPTNSPQNTESFQASTHEKQISTPEKNSDVLKLVHTKKPDDEMRSQTTPEDELLNELCESLELSDYSPESDSAEIEENDGSES